MKTASAQRTATRIWKPLMRRSSISCETSTTSSAMRLPPEQFGAAPPRACRFAWSLGEPAAAGDSDRGVNHAAPRGTFFFAGRRAEVGQSGMYAATVGGTRYACADLRSLLARASPARSGDALAGIAAGSAEERVAAQMALADLPLKAFLADTVVPYEDDEVTRLILDTHDAPAFAPVAHLTVAGLRDWLLSDAATSKTLAALAPGLTPEMVAAASKVCRLQDLVPIAAQCLVITRFRNSISLPGRLSPRRQPHPPPAEPQR